MIGFFGLNEKPSSSKDPYALRRTALGIIRIIIENKKDLQSPSTTKIQLTLRALAKLLNKTSKKITPLSQGHQILKKYRELTIRGLFYYALPKKQLDLLLEKTPKKRKDSMLQSLTRISPKDAHFVKTFNQF